MKLIQNQSFEILGTPLTLDDAWSFAEKAYRTCYQSSPKDSKTPEEFCRAFLVNGGDPDRDHMSPLEFGTVYLEGPLWKLWRFMFNKFSRYHREGLTLYVTTNLRVIFENKWEKCLKYATRPSYYHQKFYSFSIYTCIQVYKDCRTHRSLVWAVESTRTCNYVKDRFGNELTFMLLPRIRDKYTKEQLFIGEDNKVDYEKFLESNPPRELQIYIGGMKHCEEEYIELVRELHWKPQEGAQRLPQDTAAHAMFGGYKDDLIHFFNLRAIGTTGEPHPLVKDLMSQIHYEFNKRCF